MKTKYLIIMFLAGMSLISCTPCVTEKPEHEVESLDELIDSIISPNRTGYVSREIECYEDTLLNYYHIITTAVDTMGLDTLDVDAWYKRLVANMPTKSVRDNMKYLYDPDWMERVVETHRFMIRNGTHLLEKLCEKAENSYRYIDKDSLDYSITLSKNPKQLLTAQRWTFGDNNNEFYISYMKKKHVKVTAEPFDRKPVQQLIKKFLAEHKDVQQYPVCYDWDEGVPFPPCDSEEVRSKLLLYPGPKNNRDSLTASHITGIHYVIPAEYKKGQAMKKEFTNRMMRMVVDHPVPGTRLKLDLHDEGDEKYYLMREYYVGNHEMTWIPSYQIMIEAWDKAFHIIELDYNGAKRYALPYEWYTIKKTHNTDIEYIRHTKEKNTEESDTKEYIDLNFFNH